MNDWIVDQVGSMLFAFERTIRGWRFIGMAVLGDDDTIGVVRDDGRLEHQLSTTPREIRRRALRAGRR